MEDVLKLKLKALILDTIHSLETVQLLVDNGVKNVTHWLWQKQLRFYLNNGTHGTVGSLNTGMFLASKRGV